MLVEKELVYVLILLINFWHTRLQANKSAIKAVIVNRVGDFGLVLGLLSIFYVFKSFDYNTVFTLVPFLSNFIVLISHYLDGISIF